ncbi:PNPO, partial [Cordylochernes scorpioides]
MDPEQQLYTPKIEDIATAVIEMQAVERFQDLDPPCNWNADVIPGLGTDRQQQKSSFRSPYTKINCSDSFYGVNGIKSVELVDGVCWGCVFFFLISTQSYQGIKNVKLVDGVCWGCVFFFLISTQSYQGIKLVELVDGVCWGCVFFFLISTQSYQYQGIKLVELVDGVCWGCVFFFFLISTQLYQGIKLVELVDGVCWDVFFFFLISTQLYQGIKLVELVDELINVRVNTVNDVVWGCRLRIVHSGKTLQPSGKLLFPYRSDKDQLLEEQLPSKDPFQLFHLWFQEASKCPTIGESNAMTLATSTKSGKPSARQVLLKKYGKDGFQFFTNRYSRKGGEIAENPQVALLFYWDPLHRQVRVEGEVHPISESESEEYFHSRPRSSQISAMVSPQSSVVESRQTLVTKHKELEEIYSDPNIPIPKPHYWGGYLVIPSSFEFWQGQSNRLHDRIRFRRPQPGDECSSTTHKAEEGW